MPADDHRSPDPARDEAARLVGEVADRAEAAAERTDRPPLGRAARAAIDDARGHLDAASRSAGAGTEIPSEARLRQLKQAALVGMRPVTSYQVPFNRDVLAALDRVVTVVEDLASRAEGFDDGLDNQVHRLQAALATLDLQVGDLDADAHDVAGTVDSLVEAVEAIRREQATHGRALAELRSRVDATLRATREAAAAAAAGPGRTTTASADRAAEDAGRPSVTGRPVDPALVRRLADGGRPLELAEWAEVLLPVVEAAAALGPVLDLESGRGEWLGAWVAAGLDATGADDDPEHRAELTDRGLDVVPAAPLAALVQAAAPAPPADRGSADATGHGGNRLGAVTAAVLADVIELDELVAVVDAAREALAPGGALVLAVASPRGRRRGDVQWVDPRRRPVDARLLTALALDRGFAEADVIDLGGDTGRSGGGKPRAHALVARVAGGA